MTQSAEQPNVSAPHPLDFVSLGKIVQIRERLLSAQAAGKVVFRFESGDPSFAPAAHISEAVVAAMYAGKTHYVPNNGIPELRSALAEKVRTKNGITNVTSNDIFVTNGAMHALNVTFGALLSPGDEVIIPDPMWTEVAENIRLAGGVTVGVRLSADENFAYRAADIAAAITPRRRRSSSTRRTTRREPCSPAPSCRRSTTSLASTTCGSSPTKRTRTWCSRRTSTSRSAHSPSRTTPASSASSRSRRAMP